MAHLATHAAQIHEELEEIRGRSNAEEKSANKRADRVLLATDA